MLIDSVGSTTSTSVLEENTKVYENVESTASVALGMGHPENDRFEPVSDAKSQVFSNVLAAYMRIRKGGNTDAENVADQEIVDHSLAEFDAIHE